MASDFLPQIDRAKCIGCALCVKICPHDVLGLIDKVPAILDPEACQYSGVCQEICPTGAINLPYEIVFTNQ
ncbi:MAG: 4Fe-4S binding protein [Chloroflexota bacterium]